MRTGVAAKPTRPATSLLAVMGLLGDLRGQRASSACHRHRRHPVETDRPRWSVVIIICRFEGTGKSGGKKRFATETRRHEGQLDFQSLGKLHLLTIYIKML